MPSALPARITKPEATRYYRVDGRKRVTVNEDCSSATMLLPLFDRVEPVSENRIDSPLPRRTLKIEEAGDYWKGGTKPKIRLMGQWLERAGFRPGNYVSIICVSQGVIELHANDGVNSWAKQERLPNNPDCPF